MGPKPKPVSDRLVARLSPEPNTGCWLWIGNVNFKGYGQIGIGANSMRATHRVAYESFIGPIPGGLQVLHKCDVPACCNPDHLWLGTHQDNIDDKMRKGRHRPGVHSKSSGSRNGNSKLTAAAAAHIKQGLMSGSEYADLYGVTRSLVCAIQKGRVWKHVSA
jgi:hypothetical protein